MFMDMLFLLSHSQIDDIFVPLSILYLGEHSEHFYAWDLSPILSWCASILANTTCIPMQQTPDLHKQKKCAY